MKQAEDNKTIDMFDEIIDPDMRLQLNIARLGLIEMILTKQVMETEDAQIPSVS